VYNFACCQARPSRIKPRHDPSPFRSFNFRARGPPGR